MNLQLSVQYLHIGSRLTWPEIIQGITIIEIFATDLKFNTIVKEDIKYAFTFVPNFDALGNFR